MSRATGVLVSGETMLEGRPGEVLCSQAFEKLWLGAATKSPAQSTDEEEKEER